MKAPLCTTFAFLAVMELLCANAQAQEAQSTRKALLSLKHFGGEGGKVLAAARDEIAFPLYAEPGSGKVTARVRLTKDHELHYDDVRMLVYGFGEAEVLPEKTEHEVIPMFIDDGRIVSNSGPEVMRFSAGEKLELVAYIAEGWHAARYNGRYIQICGEELKVLRWEDAETWVRFKNIAGKSGWASVNSKGIKVARVEF